MVDRQHTRDEQNELLEETAQTERVFSYWKLIRIKFFQNKIYKRNNLKFYPFLQKRDK